MAAVYQNAVLVLLATLSRNSSEGSLKISDRPCPVELPWSNSTGDLLSGKVFLLPQEPGLPSVLVLNTWALFTYECHTSIAFEY